MLYTIQVTAQRSGLSAHVIRMWERRYAALAPARTCTNRRLYSDAEIERLLLLRQLTESGHRISRVVKLAMPEMQRLLGSTAGGRAPEPAASPGAGMETADQFLAAALEATGNYDADALRRLLLRARMQLGRRGLLHRVICPLIQGIGERWQAGDLRPAQEHVATGVIREVLSVADPGSAVAATAPELIVATLPGEHHELGALLVAASARDLGWRVTFLGSGLPVEEVSACARTRRAAAVAISVVYPEGCPIIEEKLRRLRSLLPEPMVLMVGGRAAGSYKPRLGAVDIHWAGCLHDLENDLLRVNPAPTSGEAA